jgi:3-hydroxyisobutyrate dehydrogenase-like beta-hydroxyacid dehydrogenase
MTTASATVGVIGLGNMGLPMAGHLLAAGFAVRGYDVRPEAMDALARAGGTPTASPAEAVTGAPMAITSLPSVAALREAVGGEHGLASAAPDGLILIETSTLPVAAKAEASKALGRVGAVVLDCPLSGTASQMRARDIAVYASGDPAALKRSHDVLAAFSRVQHEVGAFGNGMRMKLIANHLVAVHHTAAAEALLLARRAGLDPALALRALSDGAGNSRMLEIRGLMMVEGDFSHANIALEVFQKDIDLISDLARAARCPLPLFSAAAQLHLAAMAQGRLAEDPACVFAVLEGMTAQP